MRRGAALIDLSGRHAASVVQLYQQPPHRDPLLFPPTGGTAGPAFAAVEKAAKEQGVPLKFVEGRGDDSDTLDKKVVWVMDSAKVRRADMYMYTS